MSEAHAERVRAALANARLLNQRQVAALLGIGADAVNGRLKRGTLPEPVARDGKGAPLWLAEQFDER